MKTNKIRYFILLLFCALGVNAQTWNADIDRNLIKLHARLNHYDPDRYNLLLERKRVEINGDNQSLEFQGSQWQITQKVEPLEKPGRYKVDVTFKCLSGTLNNASVSVDFDFAGWNKENYVLMPGAVYNGNRYPYVQMDYTPFFIHRNDMGLDKPLMISDNPRLNFRDGYSRIQEISGSLAIPSVGFKSAASSKGFWLCFWQRNQWGDYGIDVEENRDRSKAIITLTAPMVREVQRHWFCRMDVKPSTDVSANFKAGDVNTISFTVDFFDCPAIQSLFTEMVNLRQSYYPAPAKPKLLPLSEVFKIVEQQKNREVWDEKESFYGENGDWQPGWIGGLILTYGLITEGTQLSRERVIKTLDWLYPQGISASGYYYDIRRNREFGASKDPKPFGKGIGLTRKNADATYYANKQFALLKQLNLPVKELWIKENMKALDAQVATWKKYSQLGQWINQETGELVVGNTASAGIFPASLCEAYRSTNNAEYLETAKAIGEYYHKNFVVKGIICGGPGDAMQSFDSESTYGLMESYMALFDLTADKKWLTYCEETTEQFASWIMAYDYKYPAESTLGRLDMRSNGLVWANSQNKTAVPSICTHSGISLLKLYRATGNPFYLNLLVDITHTITQFMSWPDHQIPGYKDGWIFERGGTSDWLEGLGETSPNCSFPGVGLLLCYTELPGVYVNKDTKQVFVIDHVQAKLNKKGQLEITNPTKYDAVVKVLAETKEQMAKPLGQNAFLGWKKVSVPAGATIIAKI